MGIIKKRILLIISCLLAVISLAFAIAFFSAQNRYHRLRVEGSQFKHNKIELLKRILRIEKHLGNMEYRFNKFDELDRNIQSGKKELSYKDSLNLLKFTDFLYAVTPILNQVEMRKDKLVSYLSYLSVKGSYQNIPSIWPTNGRITSIFGFRHHPIHKRKMFHNGIDIANSKNAPILSTASGKVIFSGRKGGYGKTVVIDHGKGIETQYSHLNKILAPKGWVIKKGETIGLMGSTGISMGSHIHYEVRHFGKCLNPVNFIF